MEILRTILAKIGQYQFYVYYGWMTAISVMLLWAIARQRRSAKLMKLITANFENLRARLDDLGVQLKRQTLETAAALGKQIKDLQAERRKADDDTRAIGERVDKIGEALRDQLQDLQQSVAAYAAHGGTDGDTSAIVARLDDLADEMAWSHSYYNDLKVLESAVTHLVGPEKLRQLMEKARAGASPVSKEDLLRK